MVTENLEKTIRRTPSLKGLIQSYLISRGHLSPQTQRYYRICLHNFTWYAVREGWSEEAEEVLTRENIRTFLEYVRTARDRWGYRDPTRSSSRPASPATVNHYGRVLKRLVRWATDEEDLLPDTGIWRLKLPGPHYRQVEPYTDEEVLSMLQSCTDEYQKVSRFLGSRNRAIISFLADTGMRLSELSGIKTSDVHPGLKQVRVLGKGQKMRVLPLEGESSKALQAYLLHRPDSSPWLWLSEEGQHLGPGSITSMVERLKRRSGVRSGGLVHRFRHYFATRYLEAGGNPSSLRILLGHESYSMVLHYTRMVEARKALGQHAHFSPLDQLIRGNHSKKDDWDWGLK